VSNLFVIGLREVDQESADNERRDRTPLLIAIGALALLITAALAWTIASHKTPFEREQANAEAGNPHWLEINLDTADHRRTYKEGEIIAFTVGYSSAVRQLYKLETADGGSTITLTDRLHFSDGRSEPTGFAVVCCGSRIVKLNDEPYVVHPYRRFVLAPGKYQIYLTTQRVFPWDIEAGVYRPSEWTTASNMLKVRVIPDPGWQERRLAEIQAKPADPNACSMLATLDIPAATALKLDKMRYGIRCRPTTMFPTTSLWHPSEYAAAFKILDQMVQSPTHGVAQYDVDTITQLEVWLTHPELRDFPRDKEDREKYVEAQKAVSLEYEKALVGEMCATLPIKIPEARQITQATIDNLVQNKLLQTPPCQ